MAESIFRQTQKRRLQLPSRETTAARKKPKKNESSSSEKDSEDDRPTSPTSRCPICLLVMNNRSYTDTCLHEFCFLCIKQWSQIKHECPLCKQTFRTIMHTIQALDDYQEYHLPPLETAASPPSSIASSESFSFQIINASNSNLRFSVAMDASGAFVNPFNFGQLPRQRRRPRPQYSLPSDRQEIYRRNLWVRINHSLGYRMSSPSFYRNNEALTHRLGLWLQREVSTLVNLPGAPDRRQSLPGASVGSDQEVSEEAHVTSIVNRFLEHILQYSIRHPQMLGLAKFYFGNNHAHHFIHEFYAFATSAYDMIGYDREAHYVSGGMVQFYVDLTSPVPSTSESSRGFTNPDEDEFGDPRFSGRDERDVEIVDEQRFYTDAATASTNQDRESLRRGEREAESTNERQASSRRGEVWTNHRAPRRDGEESDDVICISPPPVEVVEVVSSPDRSSTEAVRVSIATSRFSLGDETESAETSDAADSDYEPRPRRKAKKPAPSQARKASSTHNDRNTREDSGAIRNRGSGLVRNTRNKSSPVRFTVASSSASRAQPPSWLSSSESGSEPDEEYLPPGDSRRRRTAREVVPRGAGSRVVRRGVAREARRRAGLEQGLAARIVDEVRRELAEEGAPASEHARPGRGSERNERSVIEVSDGDIDASMSVINLSSTPVAGVFGGPDSGTRHRSQRNETRQSGERERCNSNESATRDRVSARPKRKCKNTQVNAVRSVSTSESNESQSAAVRKRKRPSRDEVSSGSDSETNGHRRDSRSQENTTLARRFALLSKKTDRIQKNCESESESESESCNRKLKNNSDSSSSSSQEAESLRENVSEGRRNRSRLNNGIGNPMDGSSSSDSEIDLGFNERKERRPRESNERVDEMATNSRGESKAWLKRKNSEHTNERTGTSSERTVAERTVAKANDKSNTSSERTVAKANDKSNTSSERTVAKANDKSNTSSERTVAKANDKSNTSSERTVAKANDKSNTSSERTVAKAKSEKSLDEKNARAKKRPENQWIVEGLKKRGGAGDKRPGIQRKRAYIESSSDETEDGEEEDVDVDKENDEVYSKRETDSDRDGHGGRRNRPSNSERERNGSGKLRNSPSGPRVKSVSRNGRTVCDQTEFAESEGREDLGEVNDGENKSEENSDVSTKYVNVCNDSNEKFPDTDEKSAADFNEPSELDTKLEVNNVRQNVEKTSMHNTREENPNGANNGNEEFAQIIPRSGAFTTIRDDCPRESLDVRSSPSVADDQISNSTAQKNFSSQNDQPTCSKYLTDCSEGKSSNSKNEEDAEVCELSHKKVEKTHPWSSGNAFENENDEYIRNLDLVKTSSELQQDDLNSTDVRNVIAMTNRANSLANCGENSEDEIITVDEVDENVVSKARKTLSKGQETFQTSNTGTSRVQSDDDVIPLPMDRGVNLKPTEILLLSSDDESGRPARGVLMSARQSVTQSYQHKKLSRGRNSQKFTEKYPILVQSDDDDVILDIVNEIGSPGLLTGQTTSHVFQASQSSASGGFNNGTVAIVNNAEDSDSEITEVDHVQSADRSIEKLLKIKDEERRKSVKAWRETWNFQKEKLIHAANAKELLERERATNLNSLCDTNPSNDSNESNAQSERELRQIEICGQYIRSRGSDCSGSGSKPADIFEKLADETHIVVDDDVLPVKQDRDKIINVDSDDDPVICEGNNNAEIVKKSSVIRESLSKELGATKNDTIEVIDENINEATEDIDVLNQSSDENSLGNEENDHNRSKTNGQDAAKCKKYMRKILKFNQLWNRMGESVDNAKIPPSFSSRRKNAFSGPNVSKAISYAEARERAVENSSVPTTTFIDSSTAFDNVSSSSRVAYTDPWPSLHEQTSVSSDSPNYTIYENRTKQVVAKLCSPQGTVDAPSTGGRIMEITTKETYDVVKIHHKKNDRKQERICTDVSSPDSTSIVRSNRLVSTQDHLLISTRDTALISNNPRKSNSLLSNHEHSLSSNPSNYFLANHSESHRSEPRKSDVERSRSRRSRSKSNDRYASHNETYEDSVYPTYGSYYTPMDARYLTYFAGYTKSNASSDIIDESHGTNSGKNESERTPVKCEASDSCSDVNVDDYEDERKPDDEEKIAKDRKSEWASTSHSDGLKVSRERDRKVVRRLHRTHSRSRSNGDSQDSQSEASYRNRKSRRSTRVNESGQSRKLHKHRQKDQQNGHHSNHKRSKSSEISESSSHSHSVSSSQSKYSSKLPVSNRSSRDSTHSQSSKSSHRSQSSSQSKSSHRSQSSSLSKSSHRSRSSSLSKSSHRSQSSSQSKSSHRSQSSTQSKSSHRSQSSSQSKSSHRSQSSSQSKSSSKSEHSVKKSKRSKHSKRKHRDKSGSHLKPKTERNTSDYSSSSDTESDSRYKRLKRLESDSSSP